MEINIKNAFRICVQVSCRPLISPYNKISCKLEEYLLVITKVLLQKPLITTGLFTAFMLLTLLLLLFSISALIIVTFGFACIIFLEGVALGFAIAVASCICLSCLPIIVVIYFLREKYI